MPYEPPPPLSRRLVCRLHFSAAPGLNESCSCEGLHSRSEWCTLDSIRREDITSLIEQSGADHLAQRHRSRTKHLQEDGRVRR